MFSPLMGHGIFYHLSKAFLHSKLNKIQQPPPWLKVLACTLANPKESKDLRWKFKFG